MKETMPIGWTPQATPLPFLVAMCAGKEVGAAVWAEGRRWYCWIGETPRESLTTETTAQVRTKRAAIRWLLAFCPEGTGINEVSRRWERVPNRL